MPSWRSAQASAANAGGAAAAPIAVECQAPTIQSFHLGTAVAFRAGVTQPRQYLPGSTYMLTRRVVGRHYLLRPDELVSQIYLYCLATMSEKHGIAVHGFTLMSSHSHLTVTDTRGEMGAFLRRQ